MTTNERSWGWVKKKKQTALVFITVTLILHLQMRGCVGCVETERIGLLQLKEYLKNVFNVEEESILESWSDDDRSSDCCLWERVNCSDAFGGHIVDLSLSAIIPYDENRSLNLSLLHSFPQLQTFDFSRNWFNELFDPIHGYKSFQRLEKLSTLDLFGNRLNNSVLPFLSAARSLRTLNLGFNNLEGVFPPNELANMTELRELNLYSNGFSFFSVQGYKSFQRLEKLTTLDLSYNSLNNSVLPFLSAARSLRTLNLGFSNLEGVFPPNELANMTELRVLNLYGNGFSFFSVQGLINLTELQVLDLSLNSINDSDGGDGLITTKLKNLDLSYNKFSDNARLKGLENLVELEVLKLAGNNLFNHTRSIQVFKDMSKLQQLDLSENRFTDLDSLGLVLPSSLQVLDLSENHLSFTHEDFVFPSSLQVLDLKGNQLSLTPKGYSQICTLMNLQELDLSINALTSIPYCLGNLSRLQTLDLSDNQFNGNMSSFVSGLPSSLGYLSLLQNNFNGSFLFNSLVNQTRLAVLKLSSKVGMIEARPENSWVPLFQLKILKLQNFILGSTIPGFLVHQRDLIFVDLSHNKFSGAFPTWLLQNNTRLHTLLLSSNLLAKIHLPRLGHGLQVLDISSNRIHDTIQEDIGIVFPNLRVMNFSSNQFHGTIPSAMGEMKSLQVLDMSTNGLYGELPQTFLSGCYSLSFLKLSNNRFQGKVFPEHAHLTGLKWLALDGNGFNGSLGKGLLKSKDLQLLDISDNSISGRLPHWIGRMSSLRHIYMRGNQLRGHFPLQLQNLQHLEVIDISNNSFYGSIPRNITFPSLKKLRLQSNEFTGSIPDTLFEGEVLEVLDLGNNNFSGKILNGKGSNLRIFLLRNNSFQTHFPEKICQVLSKVAILDLSHNKFKGAIPSCLGNMSFEAEGYYDNHFASFETFYSYPEIEFSQYWRYTSTLNLDGDLEDNYHLTPATIVEFLTKSRYEAYQGHIATVMYGLDLSNNQLSGEIPVEIGDLQKIISLNLSSNRLTGSIPYSISKLKDLESLDLSNNKLVGNIPPQLADLNSLGVFNVSYNNLSGEIPFKGQLGTFLEMSYIGNPHLCGRPTNKSCYPHRVSEPGASKQVKEGDGVIDIVWFYWTCGAIYISTSLALFTFLCIDSRWSQEWFYQVDLFIHHLHRFKGCFFCN